MRTRRCISVVILVAAILSTVGGGCGPKVQHSLIPQSLHSVDSWTIRWNDEDVNRGDYEVRKASGQVDSGAWSEYCVAYVGSVKHHLIADHGVSFAENFPQRGIIELEITSKTVSKFTPPDTAAEERFRGGPGENRYPHGEPLSSDVLLGLGELLFGDKVKVNSVVVHFYDLDGGSAGRASMASENVKPSQAAKVICKLITEGRAQSSGVKVGGNLGIE